ncbi:hypothetical protein Pelo_4842 [Pelomyxa schiedti]|nr:hypothetical protein Pelo_4842 [Pelomyxa schiedti]
MGCVTLLLAWFGAEWLPERTRLANPTKTRINILVWGWRGSGKSAFYNGLATSFSSGQDVLTPLQAFHIADHVTRKYTEHSLADLLPGNAPTDEMMKRLNLHFWDTWGLSERNYTTLRVEEFLNGKVEPGTCMDDSFDLIVEQGKSRIIHSVIIIVPISAATNPQSLEVLGTHVKSIIRAGRHPIVVCNFINMMTDDLEVEHNIKIIGAATYLPTTSVIKFENYVEETTRNMEKDLQYWGILRLAYRNAITYLLAHPRECYLEGTMESVTSNYVPASPSCSLGEVLKQVDILHINNASVVSSLWGIHSNKKLSAVRDYVDKTGEISAWVFVDLAGVPVPPAKEANLTLKQILHAGDTLSIRVQKIPPAFCVLGVYQARPKSSSAPEFLYNLDVPYNFLEKSVKWLATQLEADILVRSRSTKVAPSILSKVLLRSVVDVIDGKTVVYVAEREP